MRLIVGSGGELVDRLCSFPEKFRNAFLSSKILVIGVMNGDDIVGACGISKVSNYALIYIHEEYRNKGLGTRIEAKACEEAHNRSLDFVARAAYLWNASSLRVASKIGYREVVRLSGFGYVLMMIPLNTKGNFIYTLLHEACPRMPRALLHATILVIMQIIGSIRHDPDVN